MKVYDLQIGGAQEAVGINSPQNYIPTTIDEVVRTTEGPAWPPGNSRGKSTRGNPSPKEAWTWLRGELRWAWKSGRRTWIIAGAAWGAMVASAPVYAGILYLRADHGPQGWGTLWGGVLLGTTITLVNWWMERRSS